MIRFSTETPMDSPTASPAMDPAPHLEVTRDSPHWYRWAMDQPRTEKRVISDGCEINYLLWDGPPEPERRGGLLFVHGGGGHGHWWSFLAPYFTGQYRVAAPDLSGMGDSGRRPEYSAEIRAEELARVIEDAELGPDVVVIGHSFGGLTATRYAQMHGEDIAGLIIADSPIRAPETQAARKPRRMGNKRHYPDFPTALGRFRLMPEQECENEFLVEHIGRHSLTQEAEGWTWKFDGNAMHHRRFTEPYHDYLAQVKCRTALIYGEKSALLTPETADYMRSLMAPNSPVISIPEAQHHLTLDQPMAFVTAVRGVLDGWSRDAISGARGGS
jgi:pimeloyl-ACP methyl ester carboxylesterase